MHFGCFFNKNKEATRTQFFFFTKFFCFVVQYFICYPNLWIIEIIPAHYTIYIAVYLLQ